MQLPAAGAAYAFRRRCVFLRRVDGTMDRCKLSGSSQGLSFRESFAIRSPSVFQNKLHLLVTRKLDICTSGG